MKIYDCFTFYNEFELLELRLEALYDTVDCFVIVEADKTQNNDPKDFYFFKRQNDFQKYMPKIRNIRMSFNGPYKGSGDWTIEFAQRNAIMHGIQDAAPDDLILISDLDEIPAPDAIDRILNNRQQVVGLYPLSYMRGTNASDHQKISLLCQILVPSAQLLEYSPIVMEQTLHYYYLNWVSPTKWNGSVLSKYKQISVPQRMRNMRNVLPRAVNGGWHFSYMGGVDRVIQKMRSIVEGKLFIESAGDKLIDREHVARSMETGKDVYNRSDVEDWQLCRLEDIKLPGLAEFVKKYPHFVRR